ncbi:MAG: class I SAM-dependent methyltransferase [Lachnospiraceae bacterium]|nr:class I SAM-dependent methyltransferase [Lachnospiraceae bacterium]
MYNEKDIISKWNSEMYDCYETETDDVDFALSVIGLEPKRILEIACGSGRFLVPMAKAGHDITGLDFDEHMLNRISAKISDSQNIHWHKADVINDVWGNGFDIVLLAANFLSNIVSDMDYKQAQELMIQKAAGALVSGGHVLIDYAHTFHPEKWFNNPAPNVVWQGTDSEGNFGKMVLLNSTFDSNSGIIQCIRRFEMVLADRSSLVQELPTRKHFASIEQVRTWLERAGFVIEQEWGDYQGNPISESTNRAIIWAKKK